MPTASHETPYIVRDRIIFGEVFSLIPLESSWCRGYMMLQTEEQADSGFFELLPAIAGKLDFRTANSFLGRSPI